MSCRIVQPEGKAPYASSSALPEGSGRGFSNFVFISIIYVKTKLLDGRLPVDKPLSLYFEKQ